MDNLLQKVSLLASKATGFFYQEYCNKKLKNVWFVTNRHVIYPLEDDAWSAKPYSYDPIFALDIRIKSHPNPLLFSILNTDFDSKVHPNPLVDIIMLNSTDLAMPNNEIDWRTYNYIQYHEYFEGFFNFNKRTLPKTNPQKGQEVIIVRFPRRVDGGYNSLPTIKKQK